MSLLGKAVLVNWGGIVKSEEDDYNSWHSLEHMPERINITGFLRGFRAIGLKGTIDSHKYFMMYEATNKKIFESKEYLDRLNNPTSWTKKILSNYINPSRTICDVVSSSSVGLGGYFATIRFLYNLPNENISSLKKQMSIIRQITGITGIHLLKGNLKFGQLKTKEKQYRSSQGLEDEIISFAILIEGANQFCLKKAINNLRKTFQFKEGNLLIINYYKCQHILTK